MRNFLRHTKIYFWVILIFTSVFTVVRLGILNAYEVTPPENDFLNGSGFIIYYLLLSFSIALLISLLLGAIETFMVSHIVKRKSFSGMILFSTLVQVIGLTIFIFSFDYMAQNYWGGIFEGRPSNEIFVGYFMMLFVLPVARLFVEIDRKLGPGNLWKFISGRFSRPREENRIFMFIDLNSSTTIAEKLGHFKFSELISDCFRELSVVDKYHAEIYQYVGDEVVLSWPVNRSKNYEQFLTAFFAFQGKIDAMSDYFESKYGLVPKFKAGVHAGPVVVTEVGDIKRELTYHGDTMNTAARIMGKCKEFQSSLLVSDYLYNIVKTYSPYTFEDVGHIPLRGKEQDVNLFKVTQWGKQPVPASIQISSTVQDS